MRYVWYSSLFILVLFAAFSVIAAVSLYGGLLLTQ